MTQDAGRRPSSSKRSARSGRNRPTLVTSTDNTTSPTSPTDEQNEQAVEETTPTLEESLAEVQTQNPPVGSSKPRLPRFFSTVGKSAQAETSTEKDKDAAAQARLARATRAKLASPSTKTTDTSDTEKQSEPKPEVRKATARTASSTRPASPFKTRYFIGMALYLLAANFIGAYETSFFQANHLDSTLAQFSLFGLPIIIRTSTLVFLATLVIILVLLARLDLIPRNFASLTGQTPSQQSRRSTTTSRSNQSTSENVRNTPPTMKQGVKGADDALYQKYRTKQRRERKK